MLGVMIDCSRNAVMSCKAVKEYVDFLAKMGYDTLMLYTEDTYEVDNEPYFGYLRGKYTKSELKEIDAYCREKQIELIPCIQTLAHMNAIFQATSKYASIKDCDDILMIDEPRTYELLEHVFASLAECFSSRQVHIGMDEAGKVGLGKYLRKHGYEERFDLLNRHLHKVCKIADKYEFKPMLWSDMFCSLATGEDYWNGNDLSKIKEKANLPENATIVYWDYYSDAYERYSRMIQINKAFGHPVIFAGGVWTWKGFMPDNALSMKNTEVAIQACKDCGVTDILMTAWRDDGGECSCFSAFPALLYAAELVHGNSDMEKIKRKFYKLTNMHWEDFELLDSLNLTADQHDYNASKYLLYNDPFVGLNDYRITGTEGDYYYQIKQKLSQVQATSQFQSLFEVARALCKVLAVKAQLGVKTREAYCAKDKMKMTELALGDYVEAVRHIENFYAVFSAWWKVENKPFGFEVQDIRLGGLIWRLKQCSKRLMAYVSGEIESIPELEEQLLEGTGSENWIKMVTPSVMSHIFYG